MENVKETIAKNLAELRRANKLTQSALAEKLQYSDKAISRWERGETLPDIETLCRVCDIYGVPFEYLLKEDAVPPTDNVSKKGEFSRQIVICLIGIFTVWLIATLSFTYVDVLWGVYIWQLFIWALPISGIVASVCNMIWWKSKIWSILLESFKTWTFILSLYLQLLDHNPWMLFIVGIPIEAIIILVRCQSKKYK